MIGSWFDWAFRSRATGRVCIAQAPNPPLWVFLAAMTVRLVLDPDGTAGRAVGLVAGMALAWWAADEVVRGECPFRRLLGASVLAVLLWGILDG
ncbi:MAG: hypothetical protein AB7H43_05545 [Acidimicrobiia bacterium]